VDVEVVQRRVGVAWEVIPGVSAEYSLTLRLQQRTGQSMYAVEA
jgi:hypothetical protein